MVTGIPTDGGRLHIEYEHRVARLASSYATMLDAAGVLLAQI